MPDTALGKEQAAQLAAKALGLNDYDLACAVFLGDEPNPVW